LKETDEGGTKEENGRVRAVLLSPHTVRLQTDTVAVPSVVGCCDTAAEIFIPGDKRCTVLHSTDGLWADSRDNVDWKVVPCCFQEYSVNATVCSMRMYNVISCSPVHGWV